jgi:hypothetical protein
MCMCWSEGRTEQWQCHIISVTRGTVHTAVHKTHERSAVHRISHNTDDENGKCWQHFICSRRLSCNDFRQTPIVQYIYKSVCCTKLHPNRPRNVENKDINSFTLLSNVWVSCALQTREASWCEYPATLSVPPRRQQQISGSVSPLNRQ